MPPNPSETMIRRPPIYWDPIPWPYMELDKERLAKLAKLEVEFQKRELALQLEKIQKMQEVLG